ncbi:hypothetical protein DENSPDRAFT_845982 [Dentipellis sp. KUC8613]|nr:hypothetical protein DENSPDRAFT_845982 [Dentipellis sp. KUC8613]
MLCCPTPVLENAELVLKGGLLYLPSHIFGRDAPRLRCLRLSGWRISWPALTFNLTELRLEKGQPDPQATYEEFLSALRRFPALEVLSLSDIIPPLPPSATLDTSFGSAVTLSTLRYLTLRDDMLVCALTLKHLSVPLATEQTIECSPSEVFSRSIDLMFPWLDSRLDISSVNKLSILDTPSGVQFVAWDDPRHDDGDVPSAFPVSTPLIDLTIGKATAQEPVRALILTICGKLPLADLKALSVLADDTWEAQHWLDTFGDAKKVTQAQVGCGCAPSFCEALSKADPSHSINEDSLVGPEEAGLLFPHLRHLTLMCTSIENTLPEFLDCRHGLRRLALKIVQCDIDDETINGLRDTISDVQWDGKYGRFD